MIFQSTGIVKYSIDPIKLIIEIDQNIIKYYHNMIPKYLKVNYPKFGAHISVVRNEQPPKMNNWLKHNNKEIKFEYEGLIYNDEIYFWLNTFSIELEEIRHELGLSNYGDVTLSPDKKHKFHITVANLKNKNY